MASSTQSSTVTTRHILSIDWIYIVFVSYSARRTVLLSGYCTTCVFQVCNFYRPQRKFRQGNIFRSVCHSVHRWRGGGLPTREVCLRRGASAYRVVCIHGGLPTGGGGGQTPLESEKRGGGSSYRRLCIQGVSAYRGGLSRPTTPRRIRKAGSTYTAGMLSC